MDYLKALRQNRDRRSDLTEERDRLIVQAKGARVPVSHIAEAVGLSRAQVHNIIKNTSGP